MAIQWFPGHMNVTRKAIAERVKDIDVVLELLDARLPGSSANPMLAELTAGRPTLKILNKQDLADPARTPSTRTRTSLALVPLRYSEACLPAPPALATARTAHVKNLRTFADDPTRPSAPSPTATYDWTTPGRSPGS